MPKSKNSQEIKTETNQFDYILLLIYPKQQSIEKSDSLKLLQEFENNEITKDARLLVILNSSGGDIYGAVKLVDIIRSKFNTVLFAVPFYAKSAATLISLSADKIIMAPQSELGPLDLPYEHPQLEGETISAYDVVRSIEYLHDLAFHKALDEIGVRIRKEVGLSREKSIEIAMKFASDLISPILSKEDPRIIYVCFRLLLIAHIYGTEFLKNFMFRNKPIYIKRNKPSTIVRRLIWEYPDHSFAIRKEEAKQIGLEIEDSETFPIWGKIWKSYLIFKEFDDKVIRLLKIEDFDKLIKD